MKIFQATVISKNPCYLHTVLVIEKNKNLAHIALCKQLGRVVTYTQELKELNIDLNTPSVIEQVGWGRSDSNYRLSDD